MKPLRIALTVLLLSGCVRHWSAAGTTHAIVRERARERMRLVPREGEPIELRRGERLLRDEGAWIVPGAGVRIEDGRLLRMEIPTIDWGTSIPSVLGWALAIVAGTAAMSAAGWALLSL